MAERILVIEDEERIAQFLKRGLIYEGYRVDVAYDGNTGLDMAREQPPDLVILDWMLPGMDGIEVCRRLRAAGDVPILMLTAKEEVQDRVHGLDAGADDYLVKPFDFDELMARIRALFRRATPSSRPEVLKFSDLTLDTGTHRAQRGLKSSGVAPRPTRCSGFLKARVRGDSGICGWSVRTKRFPQHRLDVGDWENFQRPSCEAGSGRVVGL